ncbi:DNA repair metallo-beta-lactamase-domain-containing protein [Fennellomyces sp. T-0311]|nr:DNA repair metallo-beta-lactamase-domain-containing protein [Fennellomyces sp. T-0311]
MDGISLGCQDTANTPATSLANERNKESNDLKSKTATGGKPKKTCPFYKWIQVGTPFVVDAFSFGKIDKCEGYFLSHFHSDHYTNLASSWSHGSIYCSDVTANYVKQQLGVASKYIIPLPMNQEYALNSTVNVSLIDANHCPGSVLFLFKIFRADGSVIRHLHTGDFRANPRMCLHPLIRQPENDMIDTLYLDTTYLSGQYSFPGQEEVISATCDLAETCCASRETNESKPNALYSWLQKSVAGRPSEQAEHVVNPARSGGGSSDVLFVVGTYSIGKEKIFCSLAKRLKSKVYAPASKRALLAQQENKELDSLLTDDPLKAQVHVVPLGQIQEERLSQYLKSLQSRFSSVVAFRPTGWMFSRKTSPGVIARLSNASLTQITAAPSDRTVVLRPQKTTISTVRIYGVPYSEHSSFRELASFVSSLRIRRIVPTVNVGSQSSREKQVAILDRWQKEKKEKDICIVSYPSEEYW